MFNELNNSSYCAGDELCSIGTYVNTIFPKDLIVFKESCTMETLRILVEPQSSAEHSLRNADIVGNIALQYCAKFWKFLMDGF